MSANIKASVDGTQAIIGVGGVDQMTVSNAGVVTANSFVGALNGSSVTATGSTTARTLATRFADVVNVRDFGAIGDGVADDTAAINLSIQFANSNPNIVNSIFFPQGIYKITSSLTTITRGNILIYGNRSTIDISFTDGDAINVESLSSSRLVKVSIKSLNITSSVTRTSGAAIRLTIVEKTSLEDLIITNQYLGIAVNVSEYFYITNCQFFNVITGILCGPFGNGWFFTNIGMDAWGGTSNYRPNTVGIDISGGGGFYFTNIDITRFENGIELIPLFVNLPGLEYADIGYLFFSNISLDTCLHGLHAAGNSTATTGGGIRHLQINGSCWFASCHEYGIYFKDVDISNITGSVILLNKYHGIYIENCREINLTGLEIAFNNKSNFSNGSGVFVKNTTGFKSRSCSYMNQQNFYNLGVYNQKHGIYLDISMDGYLILDNYFNNCILEDIKINTFADLAKIKNNLTTKSSDINSSSVISPEIVFDEIYLIGSTSVTQIAAPDVKFKELTIITRNNITIQNSSDIKLKSSANMVATPFSTLTLINSGFGTWVEKSSSIL